jgi:hypothetical protein
METFMPRPSFCNIVGTLLVLFLAVGSFVPRAQASGLHLNAASGWQRLPAGAEHAAGPVLYQIIFRSSATPGHIPAISPSHTLMDSPFLIDGNGNVVIGGLVIDRNTGIVTFAGKQDFPGSGTVTSVSAGTGLTGGPITSAGTISIADGGVTTAQIGSGAATSGQVLAANGSGGASWQTLNSTLTNAWILGGDSGTGCTTSPCASFLGTSDNTSLEIRVNNQRAFRIEPATFALGFAPNIVGGFSGNRIVGAGSTIAGGGANGSPNTISANLGTIGGGMANQVGGMEGTVTGGANNNASGLGSMIPGGFGNTASGEHSFAAGQLANTSGYKGAFVWADSSNRDGLAATADYQFLVRASGGVKFYSSSGLTSGVQLASGGGSWSSVSDRNVKDHFAPVDPQTLLARVAALPITTWNYRTQNTSIRHIGPMAQDFFAAFRVGEDDRHITSIDEGGVALAAIQGLNQKLEKELRQKEQEIQLLKSRLEKLEATTMVTSQGNR